MSITITPNLTSTVPRLYCIVTVRLCRVSRMQDPNAGHLDRNKLKRSLNAGKTNINYKTKLETGNKKLRKENKPETATLAIDESTAGSNPI